MLASPFHRSQYLGGTKGWLIIMMFVTSSRAINITNGIFRSQVGFVSLKFSVDCEVLKCDLLEVL